MGRESLQHKLGHVRPPRVHITYDVETSGGIEKREIPFVVGVLADLAGSPEKPRPPINQRKFVEIDRDNFNKVMDSIEPRVALKVDNRLSNDDTRLGVELRFRSLEDFEPAAVAKQVPVLRKLLEARNALDNLRSSLIGNDKLDSLLQEVVAHSDALQRIGAESGREAGPVTPAAPQKTE